MSEMSLIDRILNGTSLRTVMRPDPAIPTNRPEHVEGFDIEDVIINGDCFWASGPKNSAALLLNAPPHVLCGSVFYYSNKLQIFVSHAAPEKAVTVFPKRRYKDHAFVARDDFRVIWDSDAPNDNSVIREAIENGARLRIAMLDEEMVWNVHNVELPVYSIEDGTFQLTTRTGLYPACIRAPQFNAEFENRFGEYFPDGKVDGVIVKSGLWPSYYMLFSDGQYRSSYGFSNASRHASNLKRYRRLKVFSDIL